MELELDGGSQCMVYRVGYMIFHFLGLLHCYFVFLWSVDICVLYRVCQKKDCF